MSTVDSVDTIYFDILERSPVGAVALGATRRGLCFLSFGRRSRTAYEKSIRRLFPRASLVSSTSRMARYRGEINGYFKGSLRSFTVPVDLSSCTAPFQMRVLKACMKIPYGRTLTYGQLAARAGSPRAARAVGNTMAANPVPIVVPCHRVLASHGLGGYSIGLSYKKKLLVLEGVQLP